MPGNIITPFAQTFFVDAKLSPDGIFVSAIDLCFKNKDDNEAVTLLLTSTSNGYPDIGKFYNGGAVTRFPIGVNTTTGIGTDVPSFSDPTTYTRFDFRDPVYLPPGEHAFLLQTNSEQYELFVARMNENILGTDRRVSKQPYSGSAFKSQNGSTWTPIQEEDVMFRLIRAKFRNSSTGVVYFKSQKRFKANSNSNFDAFSVHVNDINFGKTETYYSVKTTSSANNTLDSTFADISTNRVYVPSERKVVTNVANSMIVKVTLSSDSDFVSPIVDPTRINSTLITHYINDGGISNTITAIVDRGTGYSSGSPPTVTISAPTRADGVQATAIANVTASGEVDAVYITTRGSGYYETPTITIAAPGSGALANATIIGETSRRGGNARVRYITRKVTLASGFDARDLQVYITANKQLGHDVQVYYKVLSADDPDQNFDNKYWTRMRLDSNELTYSQNDFDFIEYKYVPSGAQNTIPALITYTSNGGTFDTFRYFAIKICLFSNSTVSYPVLRDMRAIALDS